MKPNQKQQEAIDHIYGPLLVIAGPGTGKTQLLSARVANILKSTDTNPENILCLTFTDSAATNMRTRLATLIGRAAAKVHIHTYHSFGRTILDAYQHYADQPIRLYERPIDDVTTHQILSDIQDKLPANDILKSAKISDLASTVRELKSARLTSSDIATIAEHNLKASAGLNSAISPLLLSLVPRKYEPNLPIYTAVLEELSKHISDKPIIKNIEPEANYLARSLDALLRNPSEKPSIAPLTKWKDTFFERDEAGNYRCKNYISNKKLLSLANVYEQYQNTLTTKNLFDYADMIEQAITYLIRDNGFRMSLEERYQFILLDEFQDTNPSQFDLVRALTDYDQPNVMAVGDDDQAIMEFQGAEASNLLDFQTHYAAKVVVLTDNYRSTQQILDFAKQISNQITDSFSKTHGIDKRLVARKTEVKDATSNIGGAGAHFDNTHSSERVGSPACQVRSSEDETESCQNDAARTTPLRETPFTSTISRHQFVAAPSEYAWIANQISELIKTGTPASEIAILTPKHKYIPTLLPHLASQNIPISYEKRENILEDPRINSLITAAEFVHATATGRQASHLLLPLLSAPHWGTSPLSVITALEDARASKRPALTYLQDSSDAKLAAIATFFADLAACSFDMPLETLINYMLGALPLNGFCSPYLEYYGESRGGSKAEDFSEHATSQSQKNDASISERVGSPACQVRSSEDMTKRHSSDLARSCRSEKSSALLSAFSLYENLSILRETITNHTQKSSLRLSDFISTIAAYKSANQPIINTSPYQTATEAVAIRTVHKAKGLEYSHVFLVALDDTAWGNAGGNNNTLALPKNLSHIRHTGITEDERLRILFVAITRAKTNLYLTSSLADFAGKSYPALEYLEGIEDIDPIIHNEETLPLTSLQNHWSSAYAPANLPDLSLILKRKLENYRLTPTDLITFIDIVYAGPTSLYLKLLGAPLDPASEQQLYGNFIHSALDFATKNKSATDDEILAHYLAEIDQADLTEEQKTTLIDHGNTSLPAIISTTRQLTSSPTSISELNFRSENIVIDSVPVTGKIDLIVTDEAAKTITVYDYKTTAYDSKKTWKNNSTLWKYAKQLGFYKLLLENSPKYAKYKVISAQILHTEPDAYGALTARTYDYPPADEAELKSLIQTVYKHITELNFPDIPPDADRKLKNIQEFIATL